MKKEKNKKMLRKSQLGRQTLSRRLNKLLKWKTIVECKDTYMVQNGKLIYKATEHKCNASTKLSEEVLILISTLTIGVKILCTWCQNMQQWNLSWETPQGVSRTRDHFSCLPQVWTKIHKLCQNETQRCVPWKAGVWLPCMWNGLKHSWCCTESLQQGA